MYRMISYNLHSGVGRDSVQDYARIGRMLATKHADFVLLQEMDTRSATRNTAADINALCEPGGYTFVPAATQIRPHGWFGNAILTRHPVIKQNVIPLNVVHREPRNVQKVWVQTPEHTLLLHNTHLGLSRTERRKQISRIGNELEIEAVNADVPALLAGDLNEWWYFSSLFRPLKRYLKSVKTGLSFPSQLPVFRLDRVWLSEHCKVVKSGVINERQTRHYSDHLPLFADFEITTEV
ncbi:endonuclease [Aestuariibacter sp. GS-14]|uniref:endonuclease/exonuclease/phosphatase family protein n=1 Tax=Aestuariibacter sp. GS-14 TaxID=2590670 RepID=UPI00112D6024|nr:endonuclease/exonuclease/phosphatase family protein [Aestuariibacter sp. GS-14]TPV61075.1 endonuclease [Aestuariibacter sp. GS-14]